MSYPPISVPRPAWSTEMLTRSSPGERAKTASLLGPRTPDGPILDPARTFTELRGSPALRPPLPGCGATAARWATFAEWARADPALGRLGEGHADAVAILAEAGRDPVPGALYGVWAARSGGTGAELVDIGGHLAIRGTIRFCSGAHLLDRALVVALDATGSQIVDLPLAHPGVRRLEGTWQSCGMRASDSIDVQFCDVPAPADRWVGQRGFYTERIGFWWGGAGVAACWFGAAAGVLDDIHAVLHQIDPDQHQRALLGQLTSELAAADALLIRTAEMIDTEPAATHRTAAWTTRSAVERCCRSVLEVTPRLVGVAALTRQPGLEQRLSDLNVYLRQHHGERDLAALGTAVLERRR